MNTIRGRSAHCTPSLIPIAVACMFAASAHAQVTCTVNPATGRYEAALAWQNTLGVERANAMCSSLQMNAATEVKGIPTSEGTVAPMQRFENQAQVSAPIAASPHALSAGHLPSAEIDAIAKQVAAEMEAKNKGVVAAPSPVALPSQKPAPVKTVATTMAPAALIQVPNTAVKSIVASAAPVASEHAAPAKPGVFTFAVTPSDQTFREVIGKWSSIAGWSFAPEDWAMDRDIPVGGADVFTGSFKDAVVRLLKSSLLSDAPARPCFYSNHVVRVIPASELCQRTNM